jgi:hypothetical protein
MYLPHSVSVQSFEWIDDEKFVDHAWECHDPPPPGTTPRVVTLFRTTKEEIQDAVNPVHKKERLEGGLTSAQKSHYDFRITFPGSNTKLDTRTIPANQWIAVDYQTVPVEDPTHDKWVVRKFQVVEKGIQQNKKITRSFVALQFAL